MSDLTPHDLHRENLSVSPILKPLLHRPLIVGASVSGDHRGAASPGRQLALRATHKDQILAIFRAGRPARTVLKFVGDRDLDDRTCVLAVDLLFWDSTLRDAEESVNLFREFTHRVMARSLPIVIGDIPGIFPPFQLQWKKMNEEIYRFEASYSKCVVFSFDRLYHQVINDGALDHHGVRYTLHELIPDGLHLSTLAGKVIADRMQDEWLKKIGS